MAGELSQPHWSKRVLANLSSLLAVLAGRLLTVALIVFLTTGTIIALVWTEQGRDLLLLAQDQGAALILFSGLSAAMILVVTLVWMLLVEPPNTIRIKTFALTLEKRTGLAIVTGIGMAIFAYLVVGTWYWSIAVYLIGAFVGTILTSLVIEPLQRWPKATLIGICGLSVLGLLLIALWPGWFGVIFGSPLLLIILIVLWVLLVLALAGVGLLRGRPGYGFNVAILCLFAIWLVKSIVVAAWTLAHGYPVLDYVRHDRPARSASLETLPDLYKAWRKQQRQQVPKLVVVAAAGGGIRASYWTSLVLTRLADRVPDLRGNLFAASGVSGGSLGLGLTYALLSNPNAKCAIDGVKREPCVKAFHEHDYLAGPLAATLAGYAANLLVPVFPLRNVSLEISWERAWQNIAGPQNSFSDAFSAPMSALWRNSKGHPLLLLNATSARHGERVMAADVLISEPNWIRLRTRCRLNLVEEIDLPLSAAIGASARFPLISDVGWLRGHKAQGCERFEGVADGGFYDNYGAATLLDLLDYLQKPEGGGVNFEGGVSLVVIQITNSPSRNLGCLLKTLDEDRTHPDALDYCAPAAGSNVAWDLIRGGFFGFSEPSVVDTVTQVMTVNGLEVAEKLRALTCSLGGSYYHIAMTGVEDIPLGWTLSSTSQKRLSALLDDPKGRPGLRLKRLVTEINTGEPGGQC